LTATYDDGTGIQDLDEATFNYTWSGTGTALPAATCTAAVDANTCTVTVSSTDPGLGTLTIDSIDATINNTGFTGVTPTAATGGSLTATKTWIDFDVDITPDFALNLTNDPHTFTIAVQIDTGTGLTPFPIPPNTNTGTVDWTWDAPDPADDTTGTCTLQAGGTCTVQHNSAVTGAGVLTATSLSVNYDGTDYGPIDLTTTGQSGQNDALDVPVEATKVWLGYTLTLDPVEALNLWPEQPEHVVTLQLTRLPDIPQLPIEGQDVAVTLASAVATITGVSDGTVDTPTSAICTTDATGQCQVTITSTGPGAATMSAVYTTNIGDEEVSFPAVEDAEKTWRTYRVNVTPETAENLLGVPHTFTVMVEQTDDGTTWTPVENAVPSIDVTAPGAAGAETCSTGTDAAGQCTVEVTSPSTGTVTLTATYVGGFDDVTSEFSDDAEKTWIDYRLVVDPREATNRINEPHTFVATLEVDGGFGFGPAPGETLDINATGTGAIVTIDVAGSTAGTCTTDGAGTCRITVNSSTGGALTISVGYSAQVGDTSDTLGATGTKSWIGGGIPDTGADTDRLVRVGAGLLLAGLLLLLVAIRRRTPLAT
jgi:hypothetical protein